MSDKLDKLTSLIEKLVTKTTQNRESRIFKPIVYQGRGRSLNNFVKGDQNYNDSNKNYS